MKTEKYKVKKSDTGLGLFANKNFKKGEFIIEYTGEQISHKEADDRGGKYLFTLNEEIVIDGSNPRHMARYINHSCEPNIEAVIEDDEHIMFYAIHDIEVGEELVFDYGEEYVEDIIKKEGCKCKKCNYLSE